MKKRKLLTMVILMTMSYSYMSGKEVYVYNQSSTTALHSLSGVRKIVFGQGVMNVVSKESTTPVNLSDFDYFSFSPKSETSLENKSIENEISVFTDKSDLYIKSSQMLKLVEIYSVQGNLIGSIIPMSTSCKQTLSAYPSGVYLIKVQTSESGLTKKIIIK